MKTDIQKLEALAKAATPGPWVETVDGVMPAAEKFSVFGNFGARDGKINREFIAAANPAAVLELIVEIERLQRFETAYKEFSDKTEWVRPDAAAHELGMHVADILRKRCDDLTSHNQAQAEEIVRLRDVANLKALLPEVSDALEDLELHGQHSDQGYRKLKDWYRKVALAYRVIDGPMFGAEHGELVTQNTWLRSMVEHYAQQHAPMVPITDPHGWSARLPGYDLPALLKDAERYRYMRKCSCEFRSNLPNHGAVSEADFDAECDSSISQEQQP
jgi:hypothetical protein